MSRYGLGGVYLFLIRECLWVSIFNIRTRLEADFTVSVRGTRGCFYIVSVICRLDGVYSH